MNEPEPWYAVYVRQTNRASIPVAVFRYKAHAEEFGPQWPRFEEVKPVNVDLIFHAMMDESHFFPSTNTVTGTVTATFKNK